MVAQIARAAPRQAIAARFRQVRERSVALVAGLSAEDCCVQSMESASPLKWHLGHTSWFFETFILARHVEGFRPWREGWDYLFNSYYQTVGPMHARPRRGLLTRPSLDEVLAYRRAIDEQVEALIEDAEAGPVISPLVELGVQHEQQHQELMLTDLLHLLSCNPLAPAYRELPAAGQGDAPPLRWVDHPGGIERCGAEEGGFAFDNERPRHRSLIARHALASRLVSCGEYRDFIRDGGYERPELWLSDGWAAVQREGWFAPMYWQRDLESAFGLGGLRAIEPAAPVCHVSYFEADAFARWAGARLPTEFEWESAAAKQPVQGNLADDGALRPLPAKGSGEIEQLFGDCWEWTASAYLGYPGFRPLAGSLGEYNGKFMSGQFVLRGGSLATPADHIRCSYRNFFYPGDRWQFMGIRLARDPE
ncbi:ergothioneine biosynthesis protein EgtB [Pseudomarimonas salicorniae]|uniref:Ergothioneine biosynthesis protein EgtB n=1 Tax=Pseudomarimonas salicorniae TaxID=2933270 RepID=A0ABT0GJZ0_9GAMM|nr:ergothioneine biosynthesis protein EgtB [Lysobacter sp. CAU 1642]MCK7594862.1 ergothioneine biosynthesis protein EgtB [Lysobacter sp. CAU 1642]